MRGWGLIRPRRCWYSSTRLKIAPSSIFNFKIWWNVKNNKILKFQNYFWRVTFKFCFLKMHRVFSTHPLVTGGANFKRVGANSARITTLLNWDGKEAAAQTRTRINLAKNAPSKVPELQRIQLDTFILTFLIKKFWKFSFKRELFRLASFVVLYYRTTALVSCCPTEIFF